MSSRIESGMTNITDRSWKQTMTEYTQSSY